MKFGEAELLIFSSVEAPKSQSYFVYVKILGQKQAEKMAVKMDWGFIQRFHRTPPIAKAPPGGRPGALLPLPYVE